MIAPITTTTSKDKILSLLENQYAHVEAYCDAQTTLHNTLVNRGSSKGSATQKKHPVHPYLDLTLHQPPEEYKAVMNIQKSLNSIKGNWTALQELVETDKDNDTNRNPIIASLLQNHMALSRRVVKTVQDPYHRNGIPTTSSGGGENSTERKTVALATLRASMARIQEALK